jgi:hypothetical protein
MKAVLIGTFILTLVGLVSGQTFQNLRFESAKVPVTGAGELGGEVSISDGLRVWKGFIGATEVFTMRHNSSSIGSPAISILGPNWGQPEGIIEGRYTALLTAAPGVSVSISQLGTVPLDSRSLFFKAMPGNDALDVTLGDSTLPIIPLFTGLNYVVYGADVSAFAGTTLNLEFTAHASNPLTGLNRWFLDSIEFSPEIVPEPEIIALFAIGAVALVSTRKYRQSKPFSSPPIRFCAGFGEPCVKRSL